MIGYMNFSENALESKAKSILKSFETSSIQKATYMENGSDFEKGILYPYDIIC
jgi:hypothetical protein